MFENLTVVLDNSIEIIRNPWELIDQLQNMLFDVCFVIKKYMPSVKRTIDDHIYTIHDHIVKKSKHLPNSKILCYRKISDIFLFI
jgi:hypothetical protein